MSNAAPTAPQQRVVGRPFQKGQSGNPAGRPRGSRNVISDRFLADLSVVWAESGISALRTCAAEEPAQFCRIVASLLPKQVDLDVNHDVNISAQEVLGNLRAAVMLLQADAPPLPKPLKVIDVDR